MPETRRKVIRIAHYEKGEPTTTIHASREEAEEDAKEHLERNEKQPADWGLRKIEIFELFTTWTPERYREMREVQEGQSS